MRVLLIAMALAGCGSGGGTDPDLRECGADWNEPDRMCESACANRSVLIDNPECFVEFDLLGTPVLAQCTTYFNNGISSGCCTNAEDEDVIAVTPCMTAPPPDAQ